VCGAVEKGGEIGIILQLKECVCFFQYGCARCGFAFCVKCLPFKAIVPRKDVKKLLFG
jgi:hypothetical protein